MEESRKPKILVVDDEIMIFELIRSSPIGKQFDVIHARNGAEALESFHNSQPDIVLLDLYMPIIDGFEFLKEVKPTLDDPYEVIVITGDNRDDAITQCYQLGVSAFLHKPINLIEAEEIIKRSIKIKRLDRERKEMELQLRNQQKLQAIGQLSTGIAHEVNTPMQFINDNLLFLKNSYNDLLSTVEGFREFLDDPQYLLLKPEGVDAFEEILNNNDYYFLKTEIPKAISQTKEGVDRVTGIIRAMKEFAHPGSRDRDQIDINRSIKNTLTVAWNELKYIAEVKTELAENLPYIEAYSNGINQALLNILINAAHAIQEKINSEDPVKHGLIVVKTSLENDHVVIQIQDSGSGIPESIQSRIFEPFFTTKDVGKGSGQGLSIAYNVIVKQHHGKLFFKTIKNKGTIFYIHLPLKVDSND